jgi:hypothetical protein
MDYIDRQVFDSEPCLNHAIYYVVQFSPHTVS